jgi:hypothetical protein
MLAGTDYLTQKLRRFEATLRANSLFHRRQFDGNFSGPLPEAYSSDTESPRVFTS